MPSVSTSSKPVNSEGSVSWRLVLKLYKWTLIFNNSPWILHSICISRSLLWLSRQKWKCQRCQFKQLFSTCPSKLHQCLSVVEQHPDFPPHPISKHATPNKTQEQTPSENISEAIWYFKLQFTDIWFSSPSLYSRMSHSSFYNIWKLNFNHKGLAFYLGINSSAQRNFSFGCVFCSVFFLILNSINFYFFFCLGYYRRQCSITE